MDVITWLAVLLSTSSVYMIAYVAITNHYATRKLKEELK